MFYLEFVHLLCLQRIRDVATLRAGSCGTLTFSSIPSESGEILQEIVFFIIYDTCYYSRKTLNKI